MSDIIVNKVAQSGIVTIDLELYKEKDAVVPFDLKPFLFKEMILREKDFRASMKILDWTTYSAKNVAIFCSVDAIIPMWAYMLIVTNLEEVDAKGYSGTLEEVEEQLLIKNIQNLPAEDYFEKRVVIKGCSDHPLPASAYVEISKKMLPVVTSLMFGEPCSTVPVYRKKRNLNDRRK